MKPWSIKGTKRVSGTGELGGLTQLHRGLAHQVPLGLLDLSRQGTTCLPAVRYKVGAHLPTHPPPRLDLSDCRGSAQRPGPQGA